MSDPLTPRDVALLRVRAAIRYGRPDMDHADAIVLALVAVDALADSQLLACELPDPARPRVVTEPCMKFGRPNVLGTSVDAITERVAAGDSVELTADDFGVRREDVLVACWWDAEYGPKKRRRVWGAWAKANWSAMWHSDWASVTDPPEVAL